MTQLAKLPRTFESSAIQSQQHQAEPFPMLDVYADDGLSEVQPGRITALATISAGGKKENNGRKIPFVSRDGTIYIDDSREKVPGLCAALEQRGNKALTIAFPSDDLCAFIQQRFVRYSATKLEIYGDQSSVTVFHGDQRNVYPAGTPEYREAIKACKVNVSVYFHLAEWTPDGPVMTFPDGLGLYRLRFTSRNSLHSIVGYLQTLATNYTSGRIAGMPFELSIDYRDVADPKQERRVVPVWQIVFRPPTGINFTTQTYRALMARSIEQGAIINLALPEPETYEIAAIEGPVADLDESDLQTIDSPQDIKCDAAHWTKVYFAIVEGTYLQTNEGRDYIMRRYSGNAYDGSLSAFLADATEEDAQGLMGFVRREVETRFGPLAQYESQVREAVQKGIKPAKGGEWTTLSLKAKPEVIQEALRRINAGIYEAEGPINKPVPTAAPSEPATPLHNAVASSQAQRNELREDDDDSDPFAGDPDDDYMPANEQPATAAHR
jgi:hypothetical protein